MKLQSSKDRTLRHGISWRASLTCLTNNNWLKFFGGFPGSASGKESTCQYRRNRRPGFNPWVGKISWRRKWQPTPVFLPGESHEQTDLVDHRVAKNQTWLKQLSTHKFLWTQKAMEPQGPRETLEAHRPGTAIWLMPTGHSFPMNRISGGSVSSDYGWMRAVGLLLHNLPTKQVSDWIPPHTSIFVS